MAAVVGIDSGRDVSMYTVNMVTMNISNTVNMVTVLEILNMEFSPHWFLPPLAAWDVRPLCSTDV